MLRTRRLNLLEYFLPLLLCTPRYHYTGVLNRTPLKDARKISLNENVTLKKCACDYDTALLGGVFKLYAYKTVGHGMSMRPLSIATLQSFYGTFLSTSCLIKSLLYVDR